MDHILSCGDHFRLSPMEIEYVCDSTNFMYDYRGFQGYPARVGIDIKMLETDQLPSMRLEDSAPFVQAWLWFGLLSEALDIHSTATAKPISRIFLKTSGKQKYLCTSRLGEMIRRAKVSETTWAHDSTSKRLSSCIQTALDFSQGVLSSTWAELQIKRAAIRHPVFKSILASQILCRTLLDAFCSPCASRTQTSPFCALRIIDILLLQAGWCPKDIRKLPSDVSLRYYLSIYIRYPVVEDPIHNGSEGCVCAPINHKVITPEHTHSSCDCATLRVPSTLIRGSVSNGKVVLVRFCRSPETSNTLEVKDIDITDKSTMPFVAVSHVRMVGLGNETENSLPSCQVTLIQSLADQLLTNKDGRIFFWIDTLCVPRERQLRKVALRSAWKIFSQARHTLVLDPPLYQHKFCTPEDALIRIRYSNWKMRLWTLKEGFLARELIFRFSDRLVSLRELLTDFDRYLETAGKGLTVLQKVEPPIQQDIDEKGFKLIERFEDDISFWFVDERDRTVFLDRDKTKTNLYKALRLAFLSARKFQYLVENDELQRIPIIWQSLIYVYEEREIREANPQTDQGLDQVLSRLSEMAIRCSKAFVP